MLEKIVLTGTARLAGSTDLTAGKTITTRGKSK